MTSQIGYLKLLITRSILSGPVDFEIKRVACTFNESREQLLTLRKAKSLNVAFVCYASEQLGLNGMDRFRIISLDIKNIIILISC